MAAKKQVPEVFPYAKQMVVLKRQGPLTDLSAWGKVTSRFKVRVSPTRELLCVRVHYAGSVYHFSLTEFRRLFRPRDTPGRPSSRRRW
jgi:hypothetical protein